MRIKDEVLNILTNAVTVEGNNVKITQQLDRKDYDAVNKVLIAIGGKWTSGKVKAHVFQEDPEPLLEAIIATGEVEDLKKDFNYFWTPEPVVRKMLDLVGDIPEDWRILEPSAGTGHIADFLPMDQLMCVELAWVNAAMLKNKHYFVKEMDFMALEPTSVPPFDLVVMNPPFFKQLDITHTLHALKFLKPGGTLVGVLGEGAFFRSDKKTEKFWDEVSRLTSHSEHEALEAGDFKESGTMVRARIIHLHRNEIAY